MVQVDAGVRPRPPRVARVGEGRGNVDGRQGMGQERLLSPRSVWWGRLRRHMTGSNWIHIWQQVRGAGICWDLWPLLLLALRVTASLSTSSVVTVTDLVTEEREGARRWLLLLVVAAAAVVGCCCSCCWLLLLLLLLLLVVVATAFVGCCWLLVVGCCCCCCFHCCSS